ALTRTSNGFGCLPCCNQRGLRIPVPVLPKPEVFRLRLISCAGPERRPSRLFQLIGNLIDTGFHARFVFLATRRAGSTSRADDLIAELDWQRALIGNHVGKVDEAERRVVLQAGDDLARRYAEGAGGIGFAETVLDGVRSGIGAPELDNNLAVASDDGRGHRIAIRLASGDRGCRNGNGHLGRYVLVLKNLGASGLSKSSGEYGCCGSKF